MLRCFGLAVLTCAWAATGLGAPLLVDFNDNDAVANPPGNPAPSPTQSGWLGITQTGLTGVASDFGTLDIGFVPVVGNSLVLDDRDRGRLDGGAHPLSDMLREVLFITGNPATSGNGTLDVVVSGLAAGSYMFTGYFHDNTVNHVAMDVELSVDGGATFTPVVDDALASTTTTPAVVGSAVVPFTANGVDAVHFRIVGQGGTVNFATSETAVINGFEIHAVPEPGTLALVGLAMATLVAGRRLRRS